MLASGTNLDCVRSTMVFLSRLLTVKQKGQLQPDMVFSPCSSGTRMLRKEVTGAKCETGRGNKQEPSQRERGKMEVCIMYICNKY